MSDKECKKQEHFIHGYGLSGGIATGKSTVCEILKKRGFLIIDADKIARKELQACSNELFEVFGESIFEEGIISRVALAKRVFSNKKERKILEDILHPRIQKEIRAQGKRLDALKRPYILDIPLLFESGKYLCRANVVVYAPKELQLQRVKKRDNLSDEEAQKRLDAQMDIEEKRKIADWVIDNTKDMKHLEEEVERFMQYIWGSYADKQV